MNQRIHKKKCDYGHKLNRIQLKKGFNILAQCYEEECNNNHELESALTKQEFIHNQVIAEKDQDLKRITDFNRRLKERLEEEIEQKVELSKQVDEITPKYIIARTKHEEAKMRVEKLEFMVDARNSECDMLTAINQQLKDEIKLLKTPWWKKVVK